MNILLLLLMPIYINALSLGEFFCSTAKICNRMPSLQELCDIFDLCLSGITKTPPTPIEVLNKKLNMTEICKHGLSMLDVKLIQQNFQLSTSPTSSAPILITTTQTPSTEEMSAELITVIVISSILGLGLLIGLGFIIKKKLTK